MILIGLTDVYYRNRDTLNRQGEEHYYETDFINQTIADDQHEELWRLTNQVDCHITIMKKFTKRHKLDCIPGEDNLFDNQSHVKIKEYGPKVFRNIRKTYGIKEQDLLKTFIPIKNMEGMFNFKTGGGKSPSFFFFPDNKLLMLKTLKPSEKDILLQKGFLLQYFKYVMKNPKTLLMKFYGLYSIKIDSM